LESKEFIKQIVSVRLGTIKGFVGQLFITLITNQKLTISS